MSTHWALSAGRLRQTHRHRIGSLGCARVKKSFLSHFIFTGNPAPVLPQTKQCALLVTSIVWTCGILMNLPAKPKTLWDRHITFVQRRIPAAVKPRECELCYKPTHRYVKRVLLKMTALCTAWSGRGHRLFRECTWEWQIVTKNSFTTVHRGKWGSTNECLFFIS